MPRKLYTMELLPILLLGAVVATGVYSSAILPEGNAGKICPPPDYIAPCTCFRSSDQAVTARCANFTDASKLKAIFHRNRNWNIYDIIIEDSVMEFLPVKMLEEVHFHTLNITKTTLVTLFDTELVATAEMDLRLYSVKILRGFQWRSIANINLKNLVIRNMNIKSFGQDFKDNIPKGVERLQFENTGVTSVKNQAFSQLVKVNYLKLKKGSLKKVSRDIFPRPWLVKRLDLSYQKIAALSEDFFVDMPNLYIFEFVGNLLTTFSEKVFIIHDTYYNLEGNPIICDCDIKWVFGKISKQNLRGNCAEPESLKGTWLTQLTEADFEYCY